MNINEDSNEYYRHFFQGAKVAMLLIDPFDGQIVDANAAAELFYGYSLCQLRNMNIGQINMLSIEQINTEISSATQDKKSFFNFRHKLANGNVRDVEVYSGLIKLSSHPLLYSIVHDITDRKKLEKKLELSEKKFHLIFEAANDCIELISMEGQIVDLNRNGYEQLGYTKEEMQGKHLAEFGSAESIENIPERMESIQKLGSYMFESSRIRKDGATIPIEVSSRLIELDEQPFYLSISRDITERKRAENALRKSEIRHQSLFVNMLDGYAYCRMVFECDVPLDFIYLNVNPQFEKLTGLKGVVGKKVSEVIPGIRESNPELIEIYGRVALTGIPEKFETYVEELGIWFSITVYSTEKEHFVAVFSNITEQKRHEQELIILNSHLTHEVNTRTAELSALAAHIQSISESEKSNLAQELHDEMGSTLVGISMAVGQLQRKISAPELLEDLSFIIEMTSKATQIARGVIDQLYPTILDDYGLVAAVKSLVKGFKKHSAIEVELVVSNEDFVMEQAFALAAYRITQECLTNIAKHAKASKVLIKLGICNGLLDLSINDDGIGLPDDTKTGGHGIFGMIERARYLGGSMNVGSECGKGTTAYLILPLAVARQKNKKRVLVVDDHAIVRNALRQLLHSETDDFSVEGEANDGKAALKMAVEEDWDIILLDISLPKMNGIKVLEEIRAIKSNLPIIMLSSNPEEEYGSIALSKGASYYLEKGQTEKLVEVMRRFTGVV